MNWFRRFMAGRYGFDALSAVLLGLYLLMWVLLSDTGFSLLCLLPLALCWVRALSRDINRRTLENQLFLQKIDPLRRWAKTIQTHMQDKEHRYLHCPGCRQTLRVPRNHGKLEITCPKCGAHFTKNT